MSEQAYSIEAVARQIIEQCRADIHAAVLQIEAGKDILRRTRPLLARWQRSAQDNDIRLPAFDAVKAGMFTLVESAAPRRDRRKEVRAAVRKALSDRRTRRRSASG